MVVWSDSANFDGERNDSNLYYVKITYWNCSENLSNLGWKESKNYSIEQNFCGK